MLKQIATGFAATAITAGALMGAVAMPAAAATTTAASATAGYDYDYHRNWGPYYSWKGYAKAKGHVSVEWDEHEDTNEVALSVKVYDYDHRKRFCGYVQLKVTYLDGTVEHDTPYAYKCGGGYYKHNFHWENVHSVHAVVGQWDRHHDDVVKFGHWYRIYKAHV